MKLIATLIFSITLCTLASAAPIAADSNTETKAFAANLLQETGANRNGAESRHLGSECPPPPPVEAVPEPASLALLGLGLGLAALRRRKN